MQQTKNIFIPHLLSIVMSFVSKIKFREYSIQSSNESNEDIVKLFYDHTKCKRQNRKK